MKKLGELKWIEESLPLSMVRKAMFGGFAYYSQNKLYLLLFESEGDRSYRGKNYEFDLWSGCMFPVEREFHEEAIKKFPFLMNHPILPKWLYLPLQTEDFEGKALRIIKIILLPNSIWGVIPKGKNKKTKSKIIAVELDKIDCRRPRMFSEENVSVDFTKFKNISDLKNLGPSSEKEFYKAGIKTPQQFQKMGWKKAFQKLVNVNPKNARAIYAYSLIGALSNNEWFRLSAEDKEQAQILAKKLRKK